MRCPPCLVIGVLAACKVLPPPPVLPAHAVAAAEPAGTTTVLLVMGAAMEILGDGGIGLAVRLEHQASERTAIGFELAGGRGSEASYADGTQFRHWLVAARGYGRMTSPDDHLALAYGAGLSLQASGLVTATLHGGGIASRVGDYVAPNGQLALALAIPLRVGRAYGPPPRSLLFFGGPLPGMPRPPTEPPRVTAVPRTELYLAFHAGLIGLLGETGNRLSLDLGAAYAMRARALLVAGSVADAQRL